MDAVETLPTSTHARRKRPAAPPAADLATSLAFLLYFAHIDGSLDPAEQAFITRLGAQDLELALSVTAQVNADLAEMAGEAPRAGGQAAFLQSRLTVRCLELFRALDAEAQRSLIFTLDAFIVADGRIAPEEQRLRDELVALITLVAPQPSPSPATPVSRRTMHVVAPHENPLKLLDHPFLGYVEHPYSPHPVELMSQLERDYALIGRTLMTWGAQRAAGAGRLHGVRDAAELPEGAAFLDGHTYVRRPDPSHPLELIVVGDLHGCYACLKAVLLQSDFLRRAFDHQRDPANHPDVKLVFLGDYVDRGRFSFDGVLRTIMHLFAALPDHVIILRGNHEHWLQGPAGIQSAVWPSEAVATLAAHAPAEMLEAYRLLFEAMPSSFICGQTFYVHGGVPRDDTFEARYRDLSSLNDPELRFQMMWSDPSPAEHIPVELQRRNPRFSFGRGQLRSFMQRINCTTLVRGHEKIEAGFQLVHDLGDLRLLNVFSAGGSCNPDLPVDSSYRRVTPMALSVRHERGQELGIPWPIDWASFATPVRNGFLRPTAELAFQSG